MAKKMSGKMTAKGSGAKPSMKKPSTKTFAKDKSKGK